ncbi:MAG: hypothetical protein AAF689_14490 [Pseudomonadota bacterium]
MFRRALMIGVIGALGACGARDPQTAPLLSISGGTYAGVIGTACARLEFGRRDRITYSLDADCNGTVEFSTQNVAIDGAILRAGTAVMDVTAVGANSFSGIWSEADVATDVRFERQGT